MSQTPHMDIDVITIFPEMFASVMDASLIGKAIAARRIAVTIHDLRPYSEDKHRKVDDRPFGGGPGMVMTPQPLFDAVDDLKRPEGSYVVLMCPSGTPLNQKHVRRLSQVDHMIIICGHYEGIDERVREHCVDEAVSIGDYILTGGELPAMVLVDAMARLQPGVVGCQESLVSESFEQPHLDFPQYTRPALFRGIPVPDVLLSGNHQSIDAWRKQKSLEKTQKYRPDLLND
jgi:tRNA (guanine37-N1)-methyltransferase